MTLSKKEYRLEKIVDEIKAEKSTLACINILKQLLESEKIKFPPEEPSGYFKPNYEVKN